MYGKNNYFPSHCRLLKHSDYKFVSDQGCKIITPHFIFIYVHSSFPCSRLGITVSRKVGNAVKRNKIKRYFREFFRLNKSRFPRSFDISIIARNKITFVDKKYLNKVLVDIINNEFK
jgi:ribonuclease P protein component